MLHIKPNGTPESGMGKGEGQGDFFPFTLQNFIWFGFFLNAHVTFYNGKFQRKLYT